MNKQIISVVMSDRAGSLKAGFQPLLLAGVWLNGMGPNYMEYRKESVSEWHDAVSERFFSFCICCIFK